MCKAMEDLAERRTERKLCEAARNLLQMGLSPEQVSQGTGLPLNEVTALQAEIATTA